MFEEGSEFLLRREAKGRGVSPSTIRTNRGFVENHIIPDWGETPLGEIDGPMIEDWLMSKPFSNSTRNNFVGCWKMIFDEAKRKKKIRSTPDIERFSKDGKKHDLFHENELPLLFPHDRDELAALYADPEHDSGEDLDRYGLMFGTMLLVTVSGGLRSGEIRAMHRDQVFLPQNGIAVTRALSQTNKETLPKKGKSTNPKWRALLLPQRAVSALRWWIEEYAPPSGQLFKYREETVSRYDFLNRLRLGISRSGIEVGDRWLTVHSLRYTYNTKMETVLSQEQLLQFMGHESRQMTLHYSRPYWQERLTAYQDSKEKVEKLWG
jgi:integrase